MDGRTDGRRGKAICVQNNPLHLITKVLCCYLPQLVSLTICSLYLDDPNRGLPFHFHLPQGEEGAPAPRHPLADLHVLAGHASLERLHLNINYTQRGNCYCKFNSYDPVCQSVGWSVGWMVCHFNLHKTA